MIYLFDHHHDTATAWAMACFAGLAAAIDTAGGFVAKAVATILAASAAGFGYKLGAWMWMRFRTRYLAPAITDGDSDPPPKR